MHASNWAAANILRDGDHVVVAHAVDDIPFTFQPDIDIGMPIISSDTSASELVYTEAGKAVVDCVKSLHSHASTIKFDATTDVFFGAAGPSIVGKANEYNADMIIVGTHGRSGITSFLLGSVSGYVSKNAHCPVILVTKDKKH